MRYLASVGGLPTIPAITPYPVVKQDDNGATFVVATPLDRLIYPAADLSDLGHKRVLTVDRTHNRVRSTSRP